MTDGTCDQCQIPFENCNVYIELTIETTYYTHNMEFCCARCVHTWIGNRMREEE